MGVKNSVFIVGRVGRDPFTKQGDKSTLVSFSVATDFVAKGEKKTEWHDVVLFTPMEEEKVKKLIRKGAEVVLTGRLAYNEYTAKDGVVHRKGQIVVNGFDWHISKFAKDAGEPQTSTPGVQQEAPTELDAQEVPF